MCYTRFTIPFRNTWRNVVPKNKTNIIVHIYLLPYGHRLKHKEQGNTLTSSNHTELLSSHIFTPVHAHAGPYHLGSSPWPLHICVSAVVTSESFCFYPGHELIMFRTNTHQTAYRLSLDRVHLSLYPLQVIHYENCAFPSVKSHTSNCSVPVALPLTSNQFLNFPLHLIFTSVRNLKAGTTAQEINCPLSKIKTVECIILLRIVQALHDHPSINGKDLHMTPQGKTVCYESSTDRPWKQSARTNCRHQNSDLSRDVPCSRAES